MHLDSRRLAHFLAVVDHGSINKAANHCFISQAGLTKSIRTLEAQIGRDLFERLPQGVKLTRLGETFMRHARLLDNQLGQTIGALKAQIEGDEVELRIGISMRWVLRQVIPEVLGELAKDPRKPRITVVSSHQSWRMIEDLRNGTLDIVLATPSELDDLTGIDGCYFQRDNQGVVVNKNHPLAQRGQIDLTDLAPYDWIRAAPETYSWRFLASLFLARGMVPPRARLTIDSNVLTLDLVSRTDLLGIANSRMVSVEHADQVVMLDTPVNRSRTSAILTRTGDVLPNVAQDVIQAISQRISQTEVG
jgi:DNA-binding transcriptional LysR family regulator